ncbi:MAG: hypothetical protein HFF07_08355 [Oscillospiraceae bacterium]|jgi:hypothetical protein|nr:hypothetical protein [Oscillospiraceae bacterium]
MDDQTIKLSEEIADLRERQSLTFKAIAQQYQITPARASHLYRVCLYRRRLAHYREMHERENQMTLSVKLTMGELAVLQRILSYYELWQLRESTRSALDLNSRRVGARF